MQTYSKKVIFILKPRAVIPLAMMLRAIAL